MTAARHDERSQAKKIIKEVKVLAKSSIAEFKDTVRDEVESEYAEKLSDALAQARAQKHQASLSKSRLKRLHETQNQLEEVRQELEELYEQREMDVAPDVQAAVLHTLILFTIFLPLLLSEAGKEASCQKNPEKKKGKKLYSEICSLTVGHSPE